MELSPLSVYRKGVQAVPAIRYALGVAGVIAAAMIAYNLSNSDPRKAILAFIFALAGMYLLLMFASIANLKDSFKGPTTLIVWALAILFIASLFATFSSYAFGWPEGWAELVGATPASARQTRSVAKATSAPTPVDSMKTISPPSLPPPKQPVQESWQVSDSSDDCGANRTKTVEYCLGSGAKALNWAGPAITSANCGSSISNVRLIGNRESCVAADVQVKGCGYDEFPFGIRNCRGRGWVSGNITINGER